MSYNIQQIQTWPVLLIRATCTPPLWIKTQQKPGTQTDRRSTNTKLHKHVRTSAWSSLNSIFARPGILLSCVLQFGLILHMVVRRPASTPPAIHHHVLGFSQPLHAHRQPDPVAFSHFSKGSEKWMNNFSSNTYWKQNIHIIRSYKEICFQDKALTHTHILKRKVKRWFAFALRKKRSSSLALVQGAVANRHS